MAVNGLTASTFSDGSDAVYGDGSDDGLADGPQTLPTNEAFGIAFTHQFSNSTDGDYFWGATSSTGATIGLRDTDYFSGTLGRPNFRFIDDSGTTISVELDNAIDDGNPHNIIINKTGTDAGDIDIYVDDMSTSASSTVQGGGTFDHQNYTGDADMAFYGRNDNGTVGNRQESYHSIFEFNSDVYSQSEREDFASNRGV
jgi:hypothetical protein